MKTITPPDLSRKGPLRLHAEANGLLPKRTAKRLRRTICGRPVKGKIRWLPLSSTKNATNIYYVYELTDEGLILAFYTGQLGLDQNGRKVDALYRSADVLKHGGNPELYISILIAPMVPSANFKFEGESYAAQVNAEIEEASPWFVPAGSKRDPDPESFAPEYMEDANEARS